MSIRTQSSSDNGPSAEDIYKRVNRRYDELFYDCPNGERIPYVCAVCDEFIITKSNMRTVTYNGMKKMEKVLCWDSFNDLRRPADLERAAKMPAVRKPKN